MIWIQQNLQILVTLGSALAVYGFIRRGAKKESAELKIRVDNIDKKLEVLPIIVNRLDGVDERLDGIDKRLDGIDNRLDKMEKKIEDMDKNIQSVDKRLVRLEVTLEVKGWRPKEIDTGTEEKE